MHPRIVTMYLKKLLETKLLIAYMMASPSFLLNFSKPVSLQNPSMRYPQTLQNTMDIRNCDVIKSMFPMVSKIWLKVPMETTIKMDAMVPMFHSELNLLS